MRYKRTKMKTVADLLHWEPFLEEDQINELKKVAPPSRIGDRITPQDLNGITLEQLIKLEKIGAEKGIFFAIGEALLGMTDEEVWKAPALEMLGLRNMVLAEQARIAALFESLHREPTADEVIAGIDRMNFGLFGLADWYAKRMHIPNHDDAFKTPWVRIWQCKSNDQQEAEFEKRLAEINLNKHRR